MKNILILSITLFMISHELTIGQTMAQKTGILLITFGTSYPDARKTFDYIDEEVKKQFPGTDVYWAYTSSFIRNKLERQGIHIDSPSEALERMADTGYSRVVVQSLHIIPGSEFHDLAKTVAAFGRRHEKSMKITLGRPLLGRHDDMQRMARFIVRTFPATADNNEAVVLMGHGTEHDANIYYPGLQYYLNTLSASHFIATVEGYPTFGETLVQLKNQNIRTITLTPFMSVAGDHALNDMAGDEADSWKEQLRKQGFEVNIVLKGLGQYNEVVEIWIDHLKEALDAL